MTRSTLLRLLVSGHGRAAKYILERGADDYERLIWRVISAPRSWYAQNPGAEYYAKLIAMLSNPDPMIRRVIRRIPRTQNGMEELLLKRILIELALLGNKVCRAYIFRNWKVGLAEANETLAMGYVRLRRSASIPYVIAEAKRIALATEGDSRRPMLWSLIYCVVPWKRANEIIGRAIEECPELESRSGWSIPEPVGDEDKTRVIESYDEAMELLGERFYMSRKPLFRLSDSDLLRLQAAALHAGSTEDLERFLFPFAYQAWPGDLSPLIDWAKGEENLVALRAMAALAVADPRALREVAFHLLANQPTLRRRIAEAFNRIARPEDEPILLELRRSAESEAERTQIEGDLWDVVRSRQRAFESLRREIYETTPCEFQRSGAVKGMIRARQITDELLEECLHDSDHVTRFWAKKTLRARRRARAKA